MLIARRIGLVQRPKLPGIGAIVGWLEEIDGIFTAFFQPRLDKIADQFRVAPMPVDDDDLIESVTGNLIAGGFQQVPYHSFR